MDRITLGVAHLAEVVYGLADNVEYASESSLANWHRDGPAGIDGLHAAHHAVSGQHGNGADAPFAKVLLHFRDEINWCGYVETFGDNSQCLVDGWQMLFRK